MTWEEFEEKLAEVQDDKLKLMLIKAQQEGPKEAARLLLDEAGRRGLWDMMEEDKEGTLETLANSHAQSKFHLEEESEGTIAEAAMVDSESRATMSLGTEKVLGLDNPSLNGQESLVASMNDDPQIYALASGKSESAGEETMASTQDRDASETPSPQDPDPEPKQAEKMELPKSHSRGDMGSLSPAIMRDSPPLQAAWLQEELNRKPALPLLKAALVLLTMGGVVRMIIRFFKKRK